MKIYLVGAHSTGKTTILEHIVGRYDINCIREIARSLITERGESLNEIRSDIDRCRKFQMDVLKKQILKEKKTGTPFISDRGLDIFAYFAMYANDLHSVLEEEKARQYLESYKDKDVNTIFVRPHRELIQEDGVREDLTMQSIYRIDGMVKYILESNNIDYLSLQSKHLNERLRFVENILKTNGF